MMTDANPLAPIEALADNWLAAGDAEGATAADDRVIAALVGASHQLRAALTEARQAVDALMAERDAAREALARVAGVLREWGALANDGDFVTDDDFAEAISEDGAWRLARDLRAALAQPATDEEAGSALPLHRTEAGWPRCSTCDGGGCPDCTDPA